MLGFTTQQLSSRAIARLAANPPPEVGVIQRKTKSWLLRPYPLGLRISGNNMSPLPGWLAGAQSIALNMSPIEGRVDLAVQLHFALFDGSGGYVLKPPEMRSRFPWEEKDSTTPRLGAEDDVYWPPPRPRLHRVTVDILSLHNLPKVRTASVTFASAMPFHTQPTHCTVVCCRLGSSVLVRFVPIYSVARYDLGWTARTANATSGDQS